MEQAGRLLLPADSCNAEPPTAKQASTASELVCDNFRNDRAFSEAYNTFAQETVRADHQDALNPLLKHVEIAALPRNGVGGNERYCSLLGEIVGRQEFAAKGLDRTVEVGVAAGQAKELAPALFGNVLPVKLVAAAAKDLAPALFPEPTSALPPGMDRASMCATSETPIPLATREARRGGDRVASSRGALIASFGSGGAPPRRS